MNVTKKLAALASTAALLFSMTLVAGVVLAANPAADLDQCANGSASSPDTTPCQTASEWVNGNLGSSKAHYNEGDSVAYRLRFSNLAGPSHAVTIEWDTTKSSKHALDYITSFNRTPSVATANPCIGVSGCSAFTEFDIPADPQVTGAGVTEVPQAQRKFRLYGGTITSLSSPVFSYPNGAGFSGDKSARITITFTATVANPVLAWGGHISTRVDWGLTNSAVTIPGSPYHTRLVDLDGAGGNQDRSLSSDAVTFPGYIHIVKNTTGGNATFDYAAGPSPLGNFSITTSGGTGSHEFNGITNFTTYTVTESAPPSHWAFGSLSCSWNFQAGSFLVDQSLRKATITLAEGGEITCTYNNSHVTNSPSVDTTPSETTGGIGDALTDSADLSGATSDAGGTISFYLFAPGATCSTTDFSGAVYSSTGVAVSGNGTYSSGSGTESGDNTATTAGTYTWVAVYSGDGNNNGDTSGCGDEDVAISPNSPSVDTTPGVKVNDSITIGNLADPGLGGFGDLIVTLVDGADCNGTVLHTWHGADLTPVFNGNGTYATGDLAVSGDRELHWCTEYTGDSNNAAFGPDDTHEVIRIDVYPLAPLAAGAIGLALPMLAWALWSRRRREGDA